MRQGQPGLAALARSEGRKLEDMSESELGTVRRAVVFNIENPVYDVAAGQPCVNDRQKKIFEQHKKRKYSLVGGA